ncbi:DUF2969 family protein [Vagococcus entomophilus]|uniref:DUF2969 domain-containing protein n=1 Tax=Vagococcus entomophilus TaxID=1160095 RepID=A0A430AJY3_9ENTE|nr:DUF2969 family protein [Vagococcus entomophilus]RSU08368.1 hypothetical protein CBF30_03780 [Vagococcus entomophilus]
MKKNKEIPVTIEESGTIHTLKVGKKLVGSVEKRDEKKFVVKIEQENEQMAKSYEEGYELLIRHWNLYQQ